MLTTNNTRQKITETCLRLLAIREHSQQELIHKLIARGFTVEEIEPVLVEINRQGWQDNRRFAESYARQRMLKGYGPIRIRYELQQRGIAEIDLDSLAEQYLGSWSDSLLELYQQKFDQRQQLTQSEWLKRSRFLQQRGFSTAMIRQLFAQLNLKMSR